MSNSLPATGAIQTAADQGTQKTNLENFRDFVSSLLGGAAETELTISSGSVTPPTRDGGGQYRIDTESDAATDNLDTIATTNIPDGQFIILRPEDGARTVVVKHEAGGAGQIHLNDGVDFSMAESDMSILLRRRGADWYEVSKNWGAVADIKQPNNVMFGSATVAPDGTVHIHADSAGSVSAHANADTLVLEDGAAHMGLQMLCTSGWSNNIYWGDSLDNDIGKDVYDHGDNSRQFWINGTHAARFDSSGNFLVAKTASGIANSGAELRSDGISYFTKFQDTVVHVNRTSNDGILISFKQDGTSEGSISVSGSTVSFNGGHLSFLSQLPSTYGKHRDDSIKRGTVMEYCSEKCEWFYEDWEEEEVIPALFVEKPTGLLDENQKPITKKVKIKDKEVIKHSKRLVVDGLDGGTGKGKVTKKANEQRMRSCPSMAKGTPKVAGIFEQYDDDNIYDNSPKDKNIWDRDFRVATTGDFPVRVTGPCKIGDLLMSNGDGTATVQDDDVIHSYTIAKVCQDFPDTPEGVENPELVPCQLLNG